MRMYFSFLLLALSNFFVGSAHAAQQNKICLNMIVKDESQVIIRCLSTLIPLIDYWVIVDTGSKDETKKIIKEFLGTIPGELHERPWVNFAHNRNEALQLAKNKGDYILFIDADEMLAYDKDFLRPELSKDFYFIVTKFGGMNYHRVQLIKSSLNWKWEGVVHEAVNAPDAHTSDVLWGVTNIVNTDGARSKDPKKYAKDALMLEEDLKTDPLNRRSLFYLAQSYRDAGENELALKNYEKRIVLGGWDQEVYYSLLQSGILKEALNRPSSEIAEAYSKAFIYRPSRVESLYRLAMHYRLKGDYLNGYRIATMGLTLPIPQDILFVERWIYDYGLLFEYSINAYWVEKYQEALNASKQLLGMTIPQNIREQIEKNLVWINSKIAEGDKKNKITLR